MEINIEKDGETRTYRIGKISPYKQIHLLRRIAPALMAFGSISVPTTTDGSPDFKNLFGTGVIALKPLVDAISKLNDEDTEYVLDTCLEKCSVKVNDTTYSPLKLPGSKKLMYEDLEFPQIMQLVFAVITENMARFFQGPPASS